MRKPTDLVEIERLAFSLCNLINALIQLFPDGVAEEFDEDVFLTLLGKAKEDGDLLKAAILAQAK